LTQSSIKYGTNLQEYLLSYDKVKESVSLRGNFINAEMFVSAIKTSFNKSYVVNSFPLQTR